MKFKAGDERTRKLSALGVLSRYRTLIHIYDAHMTKKLRDLRYERITEEEYNKAKKMYDKKRNRIYVNIRKKYLGYLAYEPVFKERFGLFFQMFRDDIVKVLAEERPNGFLISGLCGFEYPSKERYIYLEVQFSYFLDATRVIRNFEMLPKVEQESIGEDLAREIIPKIKDRIRDNIHEVLISQFGRGGTKLAELFALDMYFLENGRGDRRNILGIEPVVLLYVSTEHDWCIFTFLVSHSPNEAPKRLDSISQPMGFYP